MFKSGCALALLCLGLFTGCEAVRVQRGRSLDGPIVGRHGDLDRFQCHLKCLQNDECAGAYYNPQNRRCLLLGEGKVVPALKGWELIRELEDNNNEGNEGDEGSDEPSLRARLVRKARAARERATENLESNADKDTGRNDRNEELDAETDGVRDGRNEKRELSRLDRAANSRQEKPKFNNKYWVHMPRGMGKGTLDMTTNNLGKGTPTSKDCNIKCWEAYGHKCLYSQWVDGGDCIIATNCNPDKKKCESVWDVNAPGKDLNRIYCRNAYYIQEWMTWDETGKIKGPNPCSQITDDNKVRTTFEL